MVPAKINLTAPATAPEALLDFSPPLSLGQQCLTSLLHMVEMAQAPDQGELWPPWSHPLWKASPTLQVRSGLTYLEYMSAHWGWNCVLACWDWRLAL